MSDQMGGYPQGGYNPQGGYPGQGGQPPQGGYPPRGGGYNQPGYPAQGGYGPAQGYGAPQGYGGPPSYGAPSEGVSFDLSRIMPGGLIALIGGGLTFVLSFFPWYKPDCGSVPSSARPFCEQADVSFNAWDRGVAWFSVILFLLVALAFVAKALKVVPEKLPLEIIALGVTAFADILFLVALFKIPADGFTQGWGLWVALLLVLGLNTGAVMEFMKAGGVNAVQSGLSKMQSASGNNPYGGAPQGWGQGGQPGQPGYPQQQYPPQGGYPTGPQSGPHYAQPQQGYPPQGQPPRPPQGGYPPQGGGYPPQGGGYPPQGGGGY